MYLGVKAFHILSCVYILYTPFYSETRYNPKNRQRNFWIMTLKFCVQFMSGWRGKYHKILTHFLKKGDIMNNM